MTYPEDALPVEKTVAEAVAADLAPAAAVRALAPGESASAAGRIHVAAGRGPGTGGEPWIRLGALPGGIWELSASHPCWLYALFALVKAEWLDEESGAFSPGRTVRPSFPWLRNLSDFLVGSLRISRHFSREEYVRSIARLGLFPPVDQRTCGVDRPFETGPPGDVYSWFYDYSPDLDQFVESTLLGGYYPGGVPPGEPRRAESERRALPPVTG